MAEPASSFVSISGLSLTYGAPGQVMVNALQDIDISIDKGCFISLIGPSGCGKSTLLRIMGDLLSPSTGKISIGGSAPQEARLNREIGFVFQESALLEWQRIRENVALPLELRGMPRRERER